MDSKVNCKYVYIAKYFNESVIIGPTTTRCVGPFPLALVRLCSTSLIQMVTPFLCVWLWFNSGVDKVIMTLQIHTYHM